MMKIAVMAIALVMGSIAFGQGGQKTKATPEEKAYRLTTKMVKELALDGDQASKISDINMGIAQKNEAIRTATNMTKEQKQEILLSNDAARMQMYKGVLTAEQYTKCEEFEKQRAEKREAKKAEKVSAKATKTAEEVEEEL
jgi:hypothetical protein